MPRNDVDRDDFYLFLEDTEAGTKEEEEETGSEQTADVVHEGEDDEPFHSTQWPQSFVETTNTYTIAASPSFGLLAHKSNYRLSPDLAYQCEKDFDPEQPLLSDASSEKQETEDILTKPTSKTVSCDPQCTEEGFHPQGCNLTQTIFNGMNVLTGVGLLSTPFAIKEAGWTSMALLIAFALICCYTGVLLKHCFESKKGMLDYADIGEAAFGIYGRLLVSAVVMPPLFFLKIVRSKATTLQAVVMPPLFFLKIVRSKATTLQICLSVVIVVVGTISAVLGTYSSVMKIANNY